MSESSLLAEARCRVLTTSTSRRRNATSLAGPVSPRPSSVQRSGSCVRAPSRDYPSSTLCGCSLRTPPRTPGHMNRAAVATPSTANRPRSLDPVDFTSLNSRGDLWLLSPHTFTDPVPAGALHPSRHGIDHPSRAATASMRPATTNGRGSISDVMPATVRRAGTSQGKTGGRSGFGMPSLPSGPAEFATYSPGPTSECWSHRRGNASASPVLPLSCIITRRLAFAAKLRERRSFRAC